MKQRGVEGKTLKLLDTCRLSTSKEVITNERRPYVHILAVLAMHCRRGRMDEKLFVVGVYLHCIF